MESVENGDRGWQVRHKVRPGGVVFVVYAPFGDDVQLSRYPEGTSHALAQHPLMHNLSEVADRGVDVVALIDRYREDTYLVEIPAGDGQAWRVASRWKQDMGSHRTLRGLLQHAQGAHPGARIVLALEGHGAGYLPDIDPNGITGESITGGGQYVWSADQGGWQVTPAPPQGGGQPALPIKSPVLPIKSPVLPASLGVLSTYALGQAMKEALASGVGKLAAVHFNNCFNFSLELLATISPCAEYAVGYPSYNFFTAGEAYPRAFDGIGANGGLASAELAQRFAAANHAVLSQIAGHPTVGGVVALHRIDDVVAKVDDLAEALMHALPARLGPIQAAIQAAMQYDTTSPSGAGGDFVLEVPDDLTDVRQLAWALMKSFSPGSVVNARAAAVFAATGNIKAYGDHAVPWPNPSVTWDFTGDVALSLFLPNPRRKDLWDWRSPYYLKVTEDEVQPRIIEFLKSTSWVDFILKYHETTPFKGFRAAQLPAYPVFTPRAPEIIEKYQQGQQGGFIQAT